MSSGVKFINTSLLILSFFMYMATIVMLILGIFSMMDGTGIGTLFYSIELFSVGTVLAAVYVIIHKLNEITEKLSALQKEHIQG